MERGAFYNCRKCNEEVFDVSGKTRKVTVNKVLQRVAIFTDVDFDENIGFVIHGCFKEEEWCDDGI